MYERQAVVLNLAQTVHHRERDLPLTEAVAKFNVHHARQAMRIANVASVFQAATMMS